MVARAAHLIERLDLKAHPEGGFFREVFRSAASVAPADERGSRSALTTIYYLLDQAAHSRWHRVSSDEVWHFYEGDPLELFCIAPDLSMLERTVLGPISEVSRPVHVIPASAWQAARSLGSYTLAGCSVAPGFDFADFELLAACPTESSQLGTRFPEVASFL